MTVTLPVTDGVNNPDYPVKVAVNGKMEDAWDWKVDLDGTDVVISFLGLRPNAQGITQKSYLDGELGGIEGMNFVRDFGTVIRLKAADARDFYTSIKTAITDIAGLGARP